MFRRRDAAFSHRLLGRIGAGVAESDGDVPDGICTLFFPRFSLFALVKRAV